MDAFRAHQSPPRARLPAHGLNIRPFEVKTFDASGAFQGYASLFNRIDMGGDVVVPGAFRESLARRGARGVKLLYQHDMNEPIGIWTALEEDERGLYAEGRILADVNRGREVLALMKAGALDGLSIGFKTVRSSRDRQSGGRRLEKVDLWEISIVTFPLLPEARIGATKRHSPTPPPRSHAPRSTRERDLAALLHRAARTLAPDLTP